ncbi:MAG: glycosyltransferase family 4 protein [Muribaculaceae bacterium]|nr:glycosyltransferase family 4 protein [Muribaculaceae bacterium]
MKVLIVTPHFYPESFKCNDMAFELQRRGYDVSVMTAIPDYPAGKFFDGYGVFKKRRETVNGVKIHRSLIFPRHNGRGRYLALNYLSYTFFATLKSLWFSITKKYDLVLIHETSPVTVGIPATIISKVQKIPQIMWVLDLWPESLTAAGGINNKSILNVFKSITNWLYRNSKTILIGSRGFRTSINNIGDYDKKIIDFPYWVDDVEPSSENVPEFPDGFNVLFTGNMGEAQDFNNVLAAAEILDRKSDINFIFVGDGRKKVWIENYIRDKKIQNVYCLGRYPLSTMQEFYNRADVLFLSLNSSPVFSLTVPGKLQSYMASGKPVVAMINGEGRDLLKEADCGWSVPAAHPAELADLLLRISKEDKAILDRKGQNGKEYSEQHYKFNKCIDKLEEIFKSI